MTATVTAPADPALPALGDEAIRHATSAAVELLRLLDTAAGSRRTDRVAALEEALSAVRAASVTIGMALVDARGTGATR